MLIGIILGITIDLSRDTSIIEHVNAAQPVEVTLYIEKTPIEWTPARIEEEIRAVFHEEPDRAVRIAKCESGLVPDIQSRHQQPYGRERSYGIFQIHSPVWHEIALQLGYENYRTEVEDNLAMARYIYEQSGKTWSAWTCARHI